jgi:hypothetical protein
LKLLLIVLLFAVNAMAQNPFLTGLQPNTALDLGAYQCSQPDSGVCLTNCRTITDYSGFVYDPTGQQMVMFGGRVRWNSSLLSDNAYGMSPKLT